MKLARVNPEWESIINTFEDHGITAAPWFDCLLSEIGVKLSEHLIILSTGISGLGLWKGIARIEKTIEETEGYHGSSAGRVYEIWDLIITPEDKLLSMNAGKVQPSREEVYRFYEEYPMVRQRLEEIRKKIFPVRI